MNSNSVSASQMKHSKLLKLSLILGLFLVIILLSASGVLANSEMETYQFLAAADSQCPPPPGAPPCPATAIASSNGDTIVIRGNGILTVNPKTASGGGTFEHLDPDGNVLGTGTWTATELLSFKSYGPSPDTPPDWRAGKALILVHMVADGGGFEADAILTIGCRLPNIHIPGGVFEGITLNILGELNFNQSNLGITLFIQE